MPCVLIIDDEPETREVLSHTLKSAGYEVLAAASAEAGLEACRTHPVDLVVTDILMPGMSGLELIRDIQHNSPKIRIVAISGGFDPPSHTHASLAQTLGIRDTLAKPFSAGEFVAAVRSALAS